jgi:hypothetical protein
MSQFSELTQIICVYEVKISVIGLNPKELSEQLEPNNNVVAINNNFTHKAFLGYEEFIRKPKLNKKKKSHLRYGDCTTLSAAIEFTIICDDIKEKACNIRFFPKSGRIQIYGKDNSVDPTKTFVQYLQNSGIPEYESVTIVGDKNPIMMNYKFQINIGDDKIVKLKNFRDTLVTDNLRIREKAPFPIKYVDYNNPITSHMKCSIKFEGDTIPKGKRVIIWPRFGKVNIYGCKTELSASLLYEFICDIFREHWDHLVVDFPEKNVEL